MKCLNLYIHDNHVIMQQYLYWGFGEKWWPFPPHFPKTIKSTRVIINPHKTYSFSIRQTRLQAQIIRK